MLRAAAKSKELQKTLSCSLLATAFVLLLFPLAWSLDVPTLRGRVNDYANVLQSSQAQALETQLAQLERDTGHQVAVLTIPTLDGEDIEGFSIRVAENWKIGKKGHDNGAILVVAVKDRRLRLEVGYGLEGVLPDAIAKRSHRRLYRAALPPTGLRRRHRRRHRRGRQSNSQRAVARSGAQKNSEPWLEHEFPDHARDHLRHPRLNGLRLQERSPAQQHVGNPRRAWRSHDLWRSQRLGRGGGGFGGGGGGVSAAAVAGSVAAARPIVGSYES